MLARAKGGTDCFLDWSGCVVPTYHRLNIVACDLKLLTAVGPTYRIDTARVPLLLSVMLDRRLTAQREGPEDPSDRIHL